MNKAIADALAALHRYMYFPFRCDDLGYDLISILIKRTAIEEMMHVEKLAKRILFLKGDVEMKAAHDVPKTHDVKELLEMATLMETSSVKSYMTGPTFARKMLTRLQRKYLKHWSMMKNVIMPNTTKSWKTLSSLATTTWRFSLLKTAKRIGRSTD